MYHALDDGGQRNIAQMAARVVAQASSELSALDGRTLSVPAARLLALTRYVVTQRGVEINDKVANALRRALDPLLLRRAATATAANNSNFAVDETFDTGNGGSVIELAPAFAALVEKRNDAATFFTLASIEQTRAPLMNVVGAGATMGLGDATLEAALLDATVQLATSGLCESGDDGLDGDAVRGALLFESAWRLLAAAPPAVWLALAPAQPTTAAMTPRAALGAAVVSAMQLVRDGGGDGARARALCAFVDRRLICVKLSRSCQRFASTRARQTL